jgi:hypothetical protein
VSADVKIAIINGQPVAVQSGLFKASPITSPVGLLAKWVCGRVGRVALPSKPCLSPANKSQIVYVNQILDRVELHTW